MRRKSVIPQFSSEIEEALAQVMAGTRQQQQPQQNDASTSDSAQNKDNNNLLSDLSVFDAPQFNPTDFVNNRFPDEASLDGLGSYIEEVRRRLSDTESSLLDAVRVQAATAASAGRDLDQAKRAVLALRSRVEDIKKKADHSESTVVSICSSISQLDMAKRNLTESIVTINQLQLFLRAVQGLERELAPAPLQPAPSLPGPPTAAGGVSAAAAAAAAASKPVAVSKNYASINDLLRQALRYSERFEQFKDVPKVHELQIKLLSIKRRLSQQVVGDLLADLCPGLRRYGGDGLSVGSAGGGARRPLGEEGQIQACLVVDALGRDVMQEVRKEFIASHLEEYTLYLFKRGSKEASLERTERRYIWFRQLLEKQGRLLLSVFPLHWYVMQELCIEFCMRTAEELTHQLAYEGGGGGVEVAVLIYMLQKTMDVEKDLTQRMKWFEAELKDKIVLEQEAKAQLQREEAMHQHQQQQQQSDGSKKAAAAASGVLSSAQFFSQLMPQAPNLVQEYKVFGFIVSVFDRYLDKYVQHEDDTMREEMARIIADDTENSELLVLQSTQDMFLYIQESVRRASTITSARSQSTLTDLCAVWHKHMGGYATHLHTRASSKVPATPAEQHSMSVVVNSADYCRNASEGLGEDLLKLLEDKAAFLKEHNDIVTRFSQVCTFASTQLAEAVCSSLNNLVNDYQNFLATSVATSGGSSQSGAAAAGGGGGGPVMDADESFFPEAVRRVLAEHFTTFATSLLPNLFSFVITKAATQFIPRLNRLLYRPGGTAKGASGKLTQAVIAQMRVDMGPLERAFSTAPIVATNSAKEAAQNPFSAGLSAGTGRGGGSGAAASSSEIFSSAAYTKTVRREFGRIAAALRVLQLPPGERFVEGYYQIVDKEDRSETDCARLLELLGVSKEDQRQWLALLKRRGDVPPQTRRDAVVAMMGGSQQVVSGGTGSSGSNFAAGAGAGGGGGQQQQSSATQPQQGGGERATITAKMAQFFGGGDVASSAPARPSQASVAPAAASAAASEGQKEERSTLDEWKAKLGKWKF